MNLNGISTEFERSIHNQYGCVSRIKQSSDSVWSLDAKACTGKHRWLTAYFVRRCLYLWTFPSHVSNIFKTWDAETDKYIEAFPCVLCLTSHKICSQSFVLSCSCLCIKASNPFWIKLHLKSLVIFSQILDTSLSYWVVRFEITLEYTFELFRCWSDYHISRLCKCLNSVYTLQYNP